MQSQERLLPMELSARWRESPAQAARPAGGVSPVQLHYRFGCSRSGDDALDESVGEIACLRKNVAECSVHIPGRGSADQRWRKAAPVAANLQSENPDALSERNLQALAAGGEQRRLRFSALQYAKARCGNNP